MSLSVCCQWLEPRTKRNSSIVYENSIKEKNLQLGAYKSGKYPDKKILQTYHNNVDELIQLVPKLVANKIHSFRMSSNVLPLFDITGDIAKNDNVLIKKFVTLGNLFMTNNIRVTCHPGQFTVISSDRDEVIQNSIRELQYHAWMFDQMGFNQTPYYAINIHGGKSDRKEKMIQTIKNLPDNVRLRLTLENDESSYSAKQLLSVHEHTGVPIVFDSHHHVFNTDNLSMQDAVNETLKTWKDIKPLQHISNTEPELSSSSFMDRRKHSYYIHYVPSEQLELVQANTIDLDVEAKGKNLALLKMRKDFNINL